MRAIFWLGVGILVYLVYTRYTTEGFQGQGKTAKGIFRNQSILFTAHLEVAKTPQDIQQGLMHRTHLAPNAGMLFVFEDDAPRSFWMRNTLIPLDMIFITSTGRITNIVHSVPPKTEDLRMSTEPVQYVVELPGGTAKKYGITAGDFFQTAG